MTVQFTPLTTIPGVEYSISIINPLTFVVCAWLNSHTTGLQNQYSDKLVPPTGFDIDNLIAFAIVIKGTATSIETHPDYRRQHIATDLCHKAEEHLGTYLKSLYPSKGINMVDSYKSAVDGLNTTNRGKKTPKDKLQYGLKEI